MLPRRRDPIPPQELGVSYQEGSSPAKRGFSLHPEAICEDRHGSQPAHRAHHSLMGTASTQCCTHSRADRADFGITLDVGKLEFRTAFTF